MESLIAFRFHLEIGWNWDGNGREKGGKGREKGWLDDL
jgi:hypothetical protein